MDPFTRMVKIFVVVAGVLLIGGSITLVALLITRGTGSGGSASFDRILPVKGEILSIETQGETLAILVDQEDGRVVLLIDAETGELRGTLRTEPE